MHEIIKQSVTVGILTTNPRNMFTHKKNVRDLHYCLTTLLNFNCPVLRASFT